jgi:hypothetical protein
MNSLLKRIDRYDVLAFCGLGALAYGLYLVAPALAWIVVGVVLLGVGVLGAARKGGSGAR